MLVDIYLSGMIISIMLFVLFLIVHGSSSKSFNIDEYFITGVAIGLVVATLLWFIFWPSVVYFYVRYRNVGEETNNEHR